MKTIVHVALVRDTILEESKMELVFIRDGKEFHGPLFNTHKDFKDCGKRVLRYQNSRVIETEDQESNDLAVYDTAIKLCEMNGIKVYDSTLRTMKHWSFINGFTSLIHNNYNSKEVN